MESVGKQQNCPCVVCSLAHRYFCCFGLVSSIRVHRYFVFCFVGSHPGSQHTIPLPDPSTERGGLRGEGGGRTEKQRFSRGKKTETANHTHTPTHGTQRESQSSRAKLASPDRAPPDRFTRAPSPAQVLPPPQGRTRGASEPTLSLKAERAQRTRVRDRPGGASLGCSSEPRLPPAIRPGVRGTPHVGRQDCVRTKKKSQ